MLLLCSLMPGWEFVYWPRNNLHAGDFHRLPCTLNYFQCVSILLEWLHWCCNSNQLHMFFISRPHFYVLRRKHAVRCLHHYMQPQGTNFNRLIEQILYFHIPALIANPFLTITIEITGYLIRKCGSTRTFAIT